MSDSTWYYADAQRQRQGPLPAEALQQLLTQGHLTPDTLVWREGMPDWQPLRHLPALAVATAVAAQDPYAAPASSIEPVPALADELQAYAVFVGRRFPLYRRKWRLDLATANANSWNWPAFLLGAFWMLYRRMYATAALWVAGLIGVSILETALGVSNNVSTILTIGASAAAGALGNHLYLRHTQRMIARAGVRHPGDTAAQHAELAARGGTSWLAVLLGLFVFVLMSGAVGYLFEV